MVSSDILTEEIRNTEKCSFNLYILKWKQKTVSVHGISSQVLKYTTTFQDTVGQESVNDHPSMEAI